MNVLAALDLFPQETPLPTSHVVHDRSWKLSDVTVGIIILSISSRQANSLQPMGGRIILERIACPAPQHCYINELYPNHEYCDPPRNETYVRLDINDGIIPIPGCESIRGPNGSCLLEDFLTAFNQHRQGIPSFGDVCGAPDGSPKGITFLHQ